MPSLQLTTNFASSLDKETRQGVCRALSKLIAETLGKPESYVCVSISGGADMTWGGEEVPCALGTLTSIGAINLENNKTLQVPTLSQSPTSGPLICFVLQ